MTYREKSAWLMMMVTLMVGGYMASEVILTFLEQQRIPPVLPVFVKLTVTLIGVSIVGQIVLSASNIKQAEQKADKREKMIINRSQAIAGVVLSIGVASSLIHFLFLNDGNLLFFICLFSLVVMQLVEYTVQIVNFRRGCL